MLAYTIRRMMILVLMLFVLTFLIYLALDLTPGDPVSYMISPDQYASMDKAQLEALREALGLNDPFIVRYFRWLINVLKGNFGYSLSSGVAIKDIVMARLSATLELSSVALLISTIFGILFGTISALKRGSILDNTLTVFGMLGLSVPVFIFGLIAILIFAIQLKWLPVGGRLLPQYTSFWQHLPHLIMPAFVLSWYFTAGVMRYARASMLDVMNRDFIKTARSKGLPEWRVNYIHGLRVSIIPVVVLIGFRLPILVGGTVIVEEVFQWPGIGREFVDAVQAQNYPLIMMIAFLTTFAVLLVSFLIDLLTALLDPRVKLE